MQFTNLYHCFVMRREVPHHMPAPLRKLAEKRQNDIKRAVACY